MYRIVGESNNSYQVLFDAHHPIYAAHFPNNPITPGVCLMLVVGDLASKSVGRKLRMVGARNVKFLSILNPNECGQVTFTLSIGSSSSRVDVQAVIETASGVAAKMTVWYE